MNKTQFRVLYREFLFRIVDVEVLSTHAQGDSRTLLGQFASLLVFCSVMMAVGALVWIANTRNDRVPPLLQLIASWGAAHFLIATTMLVVGVFAVLSWESMFPDRRDLLVLGPLPLRARTMLMAKIAAVGTALGLTLGALHCFSSLAWPFALANYNETPAPALAFDPALPATNASDFAMIIHRDIQPMLRRLDLAAADGGAGIVIGVSEHGVRRILTYGTARSDSLFEIGSISKTFTGLVLAQMAVDGKVDLRDSARSLLPPGVCPPPAKLDVTLLDLATHYSGLPPMPNNTGGPDRAESYTDYHAPQLYEFLRRNGLERPVQPHFQYSNLGFAVLGAALSNREGVPYETLVQRDITGPLGMHDTVVTLPPDQVNRLMQGYDRRRRPTPRWDLDAFASAGGIRSSAGDMLTYLEAQLHPERTPVQRALIASQRMRNHIASSYDIALAWMYDERTGTYGHDGATGGFTANVCFNPSRDFAAVAMMNAAPTTFPFMPVLGEHIRQRLLGEPALSLEPVSVAPAGPIRSFFAYWIATITAGAFIFCCILGLQGLTAQLLPRRWFLRISGVLQLAVFCLLLVGYFMQRSPATVLVGSANNAWVAWIPSYWFFALYQQMSGSLHPAMIPLVHRAWIGLAIGLTATAAVYAAAYIRTLRIIVEEPDIVPGVRNAWLPSFGDPFETAVAQFSIRSLLRSRQHRMIFAFYLGVGLAFATLFMNAPPDLAGPGQAGSPWDPLSVPLLASTMAITGFWIAGARVVFSLPLDLRANWLFRIMPFSAGRGCLRARRRALYAVSVIPACGIFAIVLFTLWPWQLAAAHLGVLASVSVILTEFSFDTAQKLPFTCSWLPGRSNLHVTFWLWLYVILAGVLGAAIQERKTLQDSVGTAILLVCLAAVAIVCVMRNNRMAGPTYAELRFEEVPPDQVVTMNLT